MESLSQKHVKTVIELIDFAWSEGQLPKDGFELIRLINKAYPQLIDPYRGATYIIEALKGAS